MKIIVSYLKWGLFEQHTHENQKAVCILTPNFSIDASYANFTLNQCNALGISGIQYVCSTRALKIQKTRSNSHGFV